MGTERLIIQIEERGTRRVQRSLQGVGQAGAAATGQVRGLQTALVALGGALVLRQSIGLLASFGQEMSTVRAITGATGDEFRDLTGIARDLGATTRFSASEAAQGMTFLARAGFSTAEVMESIDDTLRLAQAGALDLGSAADIASNVLSGFRLEADQAGRVVDVLAKAANSSNTDVRQLGDGLKLVAPIAAGVGVSIEETTAAIGKLSDAGLQATLAGTGLRRVISELESPSRKTRGLLQDLGLTADEVRISQVGLTAAIERLARAGIDTGQSLELFGDRGGPAFEVLKAAIPDVRDMTEELKNADGTAARIAETMDDNLNGALLALRSAAQEVVLSFGDMGGSLNVLRGIVEALTKALRFLAERVEIVAGVITALLIPAVKALFGFIAAHPVGLLIIALGAAVGALTAFKDELLVTGDGMTTLGDVVAVVGENLQETFRFIKEAVTVAFAGWGIIAENAAGEVELSFRSIVKFAALVFDSIPAFATGAFTALVTVFQRLPDVLGDLFFMGANAAIRGVEYMINRGILLINQFIDEAEYATNLVLASLGQATTNFGRVTTVQLGQLKNPYKNAASELGGTVAEGFKIGMQKYGSPLADTVDDIFDRAEQRAKERTEQAGREKAYEVAPRAGGVIGGALGGPLGGALGAGAETLGRVFAQTEVGQQVVGFFGEASEAVTNFTEKLGDMNDQAEKTPDFFDGMNAAFAELKMSAEELGKAIGDALGAALDRASGALADFAISGFRNVEDLKQAFSDLFRDLAQQILQIIIKVLLLKAIEGALGGGGGILGSITGAAGGGGGGGGKQAGGPVATGQPVLVGERGPELFVPPSQGNIVPNGRFGGGETNVTVVNVDDPESVPRGMNTPEGEEVILNTIARNPNSIRRVLS